MSLNANIEYTEEVISDLEDSIAQEQIALEEIQAQIR